MAAFEISAENRKNRENNKREQAELKKINHLDKRKPPAFSSCVFTLSVI
jgi:hypothetical protein